MVNSRTKGHVTERQLVRYLKDNGIPAYTTRSAMGHDGFAQTSDIGGIEGHNIEVKNRRDVNIGLALLQASGHGRWPWLVVKPYGISWPGKWWCVTYVSEVTGKLWQPS